MVGVGVCNLVPPITQTPVETSATLQSYFFVLFSQIILKLSYCAFFRIFFSADPEDFHKRVHVKILKTALKRSLIVQGNSLRAKKVNCKPVVYYRNAVVIDILCQLFFLFVNLSYSLRF